MTDLNVYEQVRRNLVARPSSITSERVSSELHTAGVVTDADSTFRIQELLASELEGMGILKPLFQPGVTDVLVNATNEIWFDGADGLQRADCAFASASDLTSFATRIAANLGVRLDTSQPMADATFPNGLRFSALLPPLVSDGAVIAFRIPNPTFVALESWASAAISAERLQDLVNQKFSVVISGSTGAGKTTLLKALLSSVPAHERVVTIEDQTEIAFVGAHQVNLQARSANFEGIGEIGVGQLLRQALRLRPDRILVGELRGTEVLVWLQAINTGHSGSFTTIHANSAKHAVSRLELLSLLSGIDVSVAQRLIQDSIDLVLHCERYDQKREIVQVLALSERARAWI